MVASIGVEFPRYIYAYIQGVAYGIIGIMSAEQEPPVVDVCENQNPPLAPGEANKRFNFIQRHMRNSFGTLCFAIVAMMIGALPEIGVAPILVLSAWLGVHWPVRKFCDVCIGTWMCVMCVSCIRNI